MRNIHIINPAAGIKKAELHIPEGMEIYETKEQHDLELYITEVCLADPHVHFTVYGGDGTVNEAVNGIMKAGSDAVKYAVLSVVPKGSGNDFVRNYSKEDKFIGKIDVIRINDIYAANMLNIGFDCDVVAETDKVKKFFLTQGSLGYIFGVVKALFHKKSIDLEVVYTDKNDKEQIHKGSFLLADIANGKYCGGGFKSAPAASLNDGLLDVMVINNMSIPTFLRLVGDYRKGIHVIADTAEVAEKYKKLLTYHQCKKLTVNGLSRVCVDGEIYYYDKLEIEVIPSAVNISMPAIDLTKISGKNR